VRIAVDAMGGDHAPEQVVLGALDAARKGVDVQLVGDRDAIQSILEESSESGNLTLVHAPQVVGMSEAPTVALRRKKRSSIRVAMDLAAEGKVDAVVTLGNSGVALATGVRVLGASPGVDRPALASFLPTTQGRVLVLDLGASVECRPAHLNTFAVMGTVLAQAVLDKRKPRVGLLSNGTEPEKGTPALRKAWRLLDENPVVSFEGYVEANEVFSHRVDVVVCDGFVGNVFLKAVEGTFSFLGQTVRKEARRDPLGWTAGLLAKPALERVQKTVEYSEVGGALLLGVETPVLVGHGRSKRRAVESALHFAHRVAEASLAERISARLAHLEQGK